MTKLKLWLLLISLAFSSARLGIDIAYYNDQFECIKGKGYEFVIIRGYRSIGKVDENAQKNINNAKDAGFEDIDVYLFPCFPCGDPEKQVDELVENVIGFGMIWVDVEVLQWSSNKKVNQKFIKALVDVIIKRGYNPGIYTNYYQWEAIVGLDWSELNEYPLWYAHYDKSPSFSDFKAFGGWSVPTIKQYIGDTTVCGLDADLNFRND